VPLTSVDVAAERFGPAAVELLDALIAGGAPSAPVVIAAQVVARASTGRA
jgi:DNA-binding LacI/PurR family transcriptional regulator